MRYNTLDHLVILVVFLDEPLVYQCSVVLAHACNVLQYVSPLGIKSGWVWSGRSLQPHQALYLIHRGKITMEGMWGHSSERAWGEHRCTCTCGVVVLVSDHVLCSLIQAHVVCVVYDLTQEDALDRVSSC